MIDYARTVADESRRFADAIRSCAAEVQVPTCPDWTADDLLWHLTEVHAFWAGILRSGALTDEESDAVDAAKPARPTGRDAALALFTAETEALLGELSRHHDDEPAWFWLESARTVGSTRRMQAHEALMHRVDAELTAGLVSAPFDPELAADGVEHAVEVMWAWWGTLPGFEFRASPGVVELAASDLGRRWLVRPGRWVGVGASGKSYDEPGAVLTADGEVSASVRGTAEALDRWLWGRGPEPMVSGGGATLATLREVVATGMG